MQNAIHFGVFGGSEEKYGELRQWREPNYMYMGGRIREKLQG